MKENIMSALLICAEDVLGLPADEMKEQTELDLFENSLIDSLGCVSLLTAVSETLKRDIPISRMEPEDLKSLSAMAAAIERMFA